MMDHEVVYVVSLTIVFSLSKVYVNVKLSVSVRLYQPKRLIMRI